MATQTQTATAPEAELTGEQKIQQLRELFADASEVGKRALENVLKELSSQVSEPPPPIESAGRVGARLGKRSELTIIVPFVPGGAKRLRTFLQLLGGNLSPGATKVGTLHDMRFVFLDNDTKLLFATSFDGDWDTYIDDFVDVDSQTIWTSWTLHGKAGRGFAARGRKITSLSTRSRQKAGSSPIRISRWLRSSG